MKPLRIGYGVGMGVFYLAARLTGRREFFLLFFFMAGVLLYALALSLWTIASFSYVQELSESSVVKGGSARLKISVYNDKPFPLTMMRIRVEMPTPSEKVALGFNLPFRSHIDYELPLHCSYRGVYGVGMTTMEVNDLFGLVRLRFDMRSLPYYRQRELVIYPRLVSLPFLPARLPDAKYHSSGTVRIGDSGETYSDLRRYRPADSARRIHWPTSLRVRELMVKNYEQPSETSVLVVMDTSARYEGEEALRYADLVCECAAAIVHYSLRRGQAVQLADANPARPAEECLSRRQFHKLYTGLARLPFGPPADLAESVRVHSESARDLRTVQVLAGSQNDALEQILPELVRQGVSVKCYFLDGGGERPAIHPERLPGVYCCRISFGDVIAAVLSGAGELS